MISYQAAQEIVLKTVPILPAEPRLLGELCGYYLAEPLIATMDLPGFDSSAMDGYAVKCADLEQADLDTPVRLLVAADVQAGDATPPPLKSGTAQRVMTGAQIPKGTETIVIREDTIELGDYVEFRKPACVNMNIRYRGEEFKQGDEILRKGIRLNAAGVALVASLGLTEFPVVRRPYVSIINTGSEVVAQGMPLKPGELYDSNSWGLRAALSELRIDPVSVTHVEDSVERTITALRNAAAKSDTIITSGGVSKGDSDFVKPALLELGATIHFEQVAVKPGRPMCFATIDNPEGSHKTFVFGCPGNPVSVLVSFHAFVKPAILKMMGATNVQPFTAMARLTESLKKKPGRRENVRGILHSSGAELTVAPAKGQQSHMLGGLAEANCIIHFPAELTQLQSGESVEIEFLTGI